METKTDSTEPRTHGSLIVPCATVFISSFCIMVLELVAGRILARYLGSSLYTWTSIIGVVLGGITIGNYVGGRLADRFRAGKTLALLFGAASVCCVLTIILNNFVGEWMWLWGFSWPVRTVLHVSFVFLLPSTLLGTISPVVAKMALERGLPVGRTVGAIYAWGAIGSIAGTFAAGYYLISMMGTGSIIWSIGAVMVIMALLYGARMWLLRACAVFFILALGMGTSPWAWSSEVAAKFGLRTKPDPTVLYEDETQYCHVAVKTLGGDPERRTFVQDKLTHSAMVVNDITALQYSYERIMAAVTRRFSKDKERISALVLGGGGYIFPRYLKKMWPESTVDVAEIDPGVTEAAIKAFGLEPTTAISTYFLDARNYIDGLSAKENVNQPVKRYEFVYEDALDHYSVPFQLTTREFNDKIARVLTDDGIYMIELIDVFESGLFLGAFVNTLQETFGFVSVISGRDVAPEDRNTFVIVAAKHELDLSNVCEEYATADQMWYLDDSDMAKLKERSRGLVLTDDYAPVENLLAPVVLRDAHDSVQKRLQIKARELAKKAQDFAWAGNLAKTLATVEELARADPKVVLMAYGVMARIFADSRRTNEAIEVYRTALERCGNQAPADEIADFHYDFATFLAKSNKMTEAYEQLDLASQAYRDILAGGSVSAKAHLRLGDISIIKDDFQQAAENFKKATDLDQANIEGHDKLIQTYDKLGQFDNAIKAAKKALDDMSQTNQKENADKIRQYLQFLEFKKSQQKQQ